MLKHDIKKLAEEEGIRSLRGQLGSTHIKLFDAMSNYIDDTLLYDNTEVADAIAQNIVLLREIKELLHIDNGDLKVKVTNVIHNKKEEKNKKRRDY